MASSWPLRLEPFDSSMRCGDPAASRISVGGKPLAPPTRSISATLPTGTRRWSCCETRTNSSPVVISSMRPSNFEPSRICTVARSCAAAMPLMPTQTATKAITDRCNMTFSCRVTKQVARQLPGTPHAAFWAMFQGFRLGVQPVELVKRTFKETIEDDCAGIAAQLAYYFVLALFPALLFMAALASYLPFPVINDVVSALQPIAPPEVLSIIRKQLESIVAGEQTSLLTIGILGALWSSSGAMTSIVAALNKAYDIPETRPWWKVRIVAVGLTLAL